MALIKRKCDFCGKEYMADSRNLNRGWGLCCSKSCAAKKRERNKKSYTINGDIDFLVGEDPWDEEEVLGNLEGDQWGDMEIGIHD